MALRVTFDTNVLDFACRPDRFPKNPQLLQMQKVNDALSNNQIEGFYSVTMLTIEGIMRRDRAEVFSGTTTKMEPETHSVTKNADLPDAIREKFGNGNMETISTVLRVDQPGRKPLHPEVIARMKAAKAMGVKVLEDVPRTGAYHFNDSAGDYYLDRGEGEELKAWIDKAHEVARAIEARGVGYAQVKVLGESMAALDSASAWFQALDQATDVHQERAVERAFSEWADGSVSV